MTGSQLIREARRRAGLTQSELARRLGTTQPALARLERGGRSPAFTTVVRAVRACGLDLHVSLSAYDHHDDLMVQKGLAMTPGQRLDAIVELVEAEKELHKAASA